MKALYRRYRPKSLSDVVGQEQVTGPLGKALDAGKVNHAYLFIGPRGTGKTSVARILAHAVNGFEYELEDDYVDIVEIDGASNRGIDNIRELREKVAIAPTKGKYKVYIIDEVHMLTKEAFNALLKTLEEPPVHVIFIMATTDAYKVPVTITSRAQVYNFKLASPEVMASHLKKICEQEGVKIDDDALEVVVKRGGGSYRDSLSILDQISSLANDTITKELVVKAMGLAGDELIRKLLDDYTNGDFEAVTHDLREIYATGVEAKTLAEELMSQIIDEPKPQLSELLQKLIEVKSPYAEARLLVALMPSTSSELTASATRNVTSGPVPDRTKVSSARLATDELRSKDNPVRAEIPSETNVTAEPKLQSAQPVNPTPTTSGGFNWDEFLGKVQSLNDAIFTQLKGAGHRVVGETLEIYPARKIAKMILSKDNNKKILADAAGGLGVKITDGEAEKDAKNDALISKISDIMGGEVRNDAGGNPF